MLPQKWYHTIVFYERCSTYFLYTRIKLGTKVFYIVMWVRYYMVHMKPHLPKTLGTYKYMIVPKVHFKFSVHNLSEQTMSPWRTSGLCQARVPQSRRVSLQKETVHFALIRGHIIYPQELVNISLKYIAFQISVWTIVVTLMNFGTLSRTGPGISKSFPSWRNSPFCID